MSEKSEHVNPIEIDFERLYEKSTETDYRTDWDAAGKIIRELMDESYRAGRDNVITEGPARAALLDGQSHWLDEAQRANGAVGRAVANAIAEAFKQWADACRPTPRPTLDQSTSDEVDRLQDVLNDTSGRHVAGSIEDTEEK